MMMSRGLIILFIFLLYSCMEAKVTTVNKTVNLQRYAGKWYQIASFPTHFDNDCSCTFSEYTVHPDHITIQNSCFVKVHKTQHLRTIVGKARAIPGSANSHWSIEFYWPLKANYWIVYVSDDYQIAVVSEPSMEYLWILSRSPRVDPVIYNRLLQHLKGLGFDVSLLKISQACQLGVPIAKN